MSMEKMRDSIDFKNTDIKTLFRKLLLPTVLGMIFSALFVITDGIFVGKGIGSDALAAVNIVAPLWLFSTGVGLMFGVGASVVASIHLSHGKVKVARINQLLEQKFVADDKTELVDLTDCLTLKDGSGKIDPTCFMKDGLHPNEKGYTLLGKQLKKHLK